MLADVLFRIQKRLEKVGLSESRAAIAAGLSQDAIRNMRRTVESGKLGAGVNTSTIAALAPVLQTTVSWLLEERGSEELSDDYIDAPTVIDVPLISWESAAKLGMSGAPVLAQDMSRVVRVVDLDPQGNWIALRVSGNVMNLVSPHDSIIFVNRRDRRLEPFKYYLIGTATEALYRRFRPPHFWEGVSTDPQFNKPVVLIEPTTIIGRVKKSRTDL